MGPPAPERGPAHIAVKLVSEHDAVVRFHNVQGHRMTARIVAFLVAVVLVLVFLIAVPIGEYFTYGPIHVQNSSFKAIERGLNAVGLKGQTFLMPSKNLYCEYWYDAKSDGMRESRYEVLNTWSNLGFIVFGAIQWLTVWRNDEMVLLMATVAMFMGVGSFLFHRYGYYAYWALDVLPMAMFQATLAMALYSTALRGFFRPFLREVRRDAMGKPLKEWDFSTAAIPAVFKVMILIPFVFFWTLMCWTFLMLINQSTVKVTDRYSVFLLNNPAVNPKDMENEPIVDLGATDLIVAGAVPLGVVMIAFMVSNFVNWAAPPHFPSGERTKQSDDVHEAEASKAIVGTEPWVVAGLIFRAFFLLIVAFASREPEAAHNGGDGCADMPEGPLQGHFFWHLFAALSLHHVACFIAYSRAELYKLDGVVHYFPYNCYVTKTDEKIGANRSWQWWLLRWVPWVTWDELAPTVAKSLLMAELGEQRVRLLEEQSIQGRCQDQQHFVQRAVRFFDYFDMQGVTFDVSKLSSRFERQGKLFFLELRENPNPQYEAWFFEVVGDFFEQFRPDANAAAVGDDVGQFIAVTNPATRLDLAGSCNATISEV